MSKFVAVTEIIWDSIVKEHVQAEAIRIRANRLLERGRAILRTYPKLSLPVQLFVHKLVARLRGRVLGWSWLQSLWLAKWLLLSIVVWVVMLLWAVR